MLDFLGLKKRGHKRKGQRKASEGKAAMAYMRRLHGGPSVTSDYAPVDDLADLAEREQTTDTMKKENNNNRRQAQ